MENPTTTILYHITRIIRPTLNIFLKTLHILQKKTSKLVTKIWLPNLILYQTAYSKFNIFHWRKWTWKWCLQNGVHFVSASMCCGETCIKQPLNLVVSQDRWSFTAGRINMILWRLCQVNDEIHTTCTSKTFPVSLYRFHCNIYWVSIVNALVTIRCPVCGHHGGKMKILKRFYFLLLAIVNI